MLSPAENVETELPQSCMLHKSIAPLKEGFVVAFAVHFNQKSKHDLRVQSCSDRQWGCVFIVVVALELLRSQVNLQYHLQNNSSIIKVNLYNLWLYFRLPTHSRGFKWDATAISVKRMFSDACPNAESVCTRQQQLWRHDVLKSDPSTMWKHAYLQVANGCSNPLWKSELVRLTHIWYIAWSPASLQMPR